MDSFLDKEVLSQVEQKELLEKCLATEPIIEELGDNWVEETLALPDDYFDKKNPKDPKHIKGNFREFCDNCKKEFYVPITQMGCPRCGLPFLREEEYNV